MGGDLKKIRVVGEYMIEVCFVYDMYVVLITFSPGLESMWHGHVQSEICVVL